MAKGIPDGNGLVKDKAKRKGLELHYFRLRYNKDTGLIDTEEFVGKDALTTSLADNPLYEDELLVHGRMLQLVIEVR